MQLNECNNQNTTWILDSAAPLGHGPNGKADHTSHSSASHLPTGAAKFCGTWRVVESDDYDNFLRDLGVSYLYRTAFSKLCPVRQPWP